MPPRRRAAKPADAARLGERGTQLLAQLEELLDLTGPARVLAVEAARIADRLEALDAAINAGGAILERMHYRLDLDDYFGDDPVLNVTVKVDAVLSEARQQQGRLTAVLSALGVEVPKKPATPAPAEAGPPQPEAKRTPLDELEEKRATRAAGAAAKGASRTRGRRR